MLPGKRNAAFSWATAGTPSVAIVAMVAPSLAHHALLEELLAIAQPPELAAALENAMQDWWPVAGA
jgi:hypothetical protein